MKIRKILYICSSAKARKCVRESCPHFNKHLYRKKTKTNNMYAACNRDCLWDIKSKCVPFYKRKKNADK